MSSPNAQSLRLSDKNLPKLTTLPTKCRGAGFFFSFFFRNMFRTEGVKTDIFVNGAKSIAKG